MAKSTKTDPNEAIQDELDPHGREDLRRAMLETGRRLREGGVELTGRETSEELVALLEAVERFERAVESRGGDLMVDEGPHGVTREPDDVHFVLPRRHPHEPVTDYLVRLSAATGAVLEHPPIDG